MWIKIISLVKFCMRKRTLKSQEKKIVTKIIKITITGIGKRENRIRIRNIKTIRARK